MRAAREQLRFLLAEPRDVDVEGTLAASVEPVPAATTRCWRRRSRTGRSSARWSTQQGVYTELIKIAGAAGKPRVDFSASWGQQRLAISTLSGTGSAWNAALVATVPLFDGWRTKGLVAQAKSNRASLDIDALKLRTPSRWRSALAVWTARGKRPNC